MIICELREKYSLNMLLQIADLPRSTFYYQLKHFDDREKKDQALKEMIEGIFLENHRKYGSPRITQELKNQGYQVNKKRVERIMRENRISAVPKRRRYRSYRGTVGRIAPNILDRDFSTERPYEKLGTDVTVFITQYGKLYLSPIIDFHTREILAYDLSDHPTFSQIRRMLNQLVHDHGEHLQGTVLHSDQGWQYQMRYYHKFLKDHGMIQSMSRKGNCLDNSPTENFFGRLKTEIYYDREYSFKSLSDLRRTIKRYIVYYNQERIVTRLSTSPVKYRETLEKTGW